MVTNSKEYMREYMRKYIKAKGGEFYTCPDCAKEVKKYNKTKHNKTKFHLKRVHTDDIEILKEELAHLKLMIKEVS